MKRTSMLRLLLFAVATAVIVYFLPRVDENNYNYDVNRPWNYSLLTAPFDIPVHLDSVRAKEVKDSIDAVFVPVYKRMESTEAVAREEFGKVLDGLPNMNASQRDRALRGFEKILSNGIVDQRTYNSIQAGKLPYVRNVRGNVARNISTSNFRSPRAGYAALDSVMPSGSMNTVARTELTKLLTPNMVYDTVGSQRFLDDLYRKAMAPVGVIQQGERIIDRGDIVTLKLFTVLRTYEHMKAEKGRDSATQNVYPLAGQTLYVLLLLMCVYTFLYFFRRTLFDNLKVCTFLVLLVTVFTVFGFIMAETFVSGIYIVPFTMVAIMVLVFFDGRTAMFVYIVTILLSSVIASYPLEFIALQFVAGVTAINSLKELSRRSQLLRTALLVFVAYTLCYVAVEVMTSGTLNTISTRMIGFLGINVVFVSFAYVLVFVFEKVFGFTSEVALVELSDINNPLLRELSQECPGTFQHSMSVSNLASEAAHSIGANVQLVRTGALYHDLGKINNPAFFTENQHGVNPHDALDPQQSARVVISHVTDGLKRADKAKLPQVIKNFISEHHGRGTARYFYTTYCKAHPDEDVDAAPFTYPGPNPQSRETSILMMADAVEAASRSLKEYTTESITNLVNNIVDGQVREGLHNESPLSFRDVAMIKKSFIQRLGTIYHTRIAYPEAPKRAES
ncbi:MAG: HDIG domain-containing protein [Muribaculaceae bacterium]|nr:HDIG domain-containing protein [Muribaculaceae bacterium]